MKFKMNLQKIKDNKSFQIIAIVIGVYIVLVAIVYFLLINTKFSEVGRINAKIKEKKEAISQSGGIDKQKEKIAKAKEEIEQLKEQINFYEAKLPTEKDIPQILQYLSQIARESNIKLLKIEKLKEKQSQQEQALYITVPLVLELKGGYHSIGRFMSKIENAQRFMKVEDFQIEKDKKTPLEHKAQLLLHTYKLSEKKANRQNEDETG